MGTSFGGFWMDCQRRRKGIILCPKDSIGETQEIGRIRARPGGLAA
jgi:hypothetical protein